VRIDAGRLFVDRAHAVDAVFALTHHHRGRRAGAASRRCPAGDRLARKRIVAMGPLRS
jgi:hypothetical protein